MNKSFSRVCTLTHRNIKEIVRDPLSLVFMVGLPVVMLVLFWLIFHNLTAQFQIKYLAPSIIVFGQAFITLFAGMLISIDKSTSFLTRLYVSPAKSHEFIFGYSFALIPLGLAQAILFLLVGGILDASIFNASMLLTIVVSLLPCIMFVGLGILFGALCNERSIGGVASIVIVGQSVLSGMWFPVDTLSGGIQVFMNILPFRNATQLMINVTNGYSNLFNDIILPAMIVLAYAVAVFALAIFVYNKKMKNR